MQSHPQGLVDVALPIELHPKILILCFIYIDQNTILKCRLMTRCLTTLELPE